MDDVVKQLVGSLETDLANKTTKAVVSWLKENADTLKESLNIVICDFVEKFDFINTVIALNSS